MVKKILLIFFLIFARNSYCAQEESYELARLIDNIESNKVYDVRNFLSSNQFDQKTLIEASKFAKKQMESAFNVGNKANVEKYKEIIKLLKAEPLKQKLRPYLTEDIVDIIVGYEQEIVDPIKKEKLKKEIRQTLSIFLGFLGVVYADDIRVNKFIEFLDEFEFLPKDEIIYILKYLQDLLLYHDVDLRIEEYSWNPIHKAPEVYLIRKNKYKEKISNFQNYSPSFKYIIQSLESSITNEKNHSEVFVIEYLIYEYLYLLLGEQTAIDNHILSPENLKKEMITRYLDKF